MKKIVHVLVKSQKEKLFMRMFISCKTLQERIDVIHLMFENKLDDLASNLIQLISSKHFNFQSYVDSTPINWQYVSTGRTTTPARKTKWTIGRVFRVGQKFKTKVQKAIWNKCR